MFILIHILKNEFFSHYLLVLKIHFLFDAFVQKENYGININQKSSFLRQQKWQGSRTFITKKKLTKKKIK
jgi:hypothetical protein